MTMPATEPSLFTALSEGRLDFAYGLSLWLFPAAALVLTGLVWLAYRRRTRPLSRGWLSYFIGIRSLLLALLLFCLLRPSVTVPQLTPQETYLGVLFDSSLSMSIADESAGGLQRSGRPRTDAVQEAFFDSGLMARLGRDFQLRAFRFDSATRRLSYRAAGAGDPASTIELSDTGGTASSLAQALDHVRRQLSGLPLSGVVLVTDGADNSGLDPVAAARRLAELQVPVYSVGVGTEEIPRDIAVTDVDAARALHDPARFTLQARLQQRGYSGQRVEVSVKDAAGAAVATEWITLDEDGTPRSYDLEIDRQQADPPAVYELSVAVQPDEIIPENNRYRFLIDGGDEPTFDILYVEGHPRNEYKFIRRAVAGDGSLRVASYLQTGPGKYYRQGIESPGELAAGFPRDRESLYAYEALILGDIEAGFFSPQQLQMIEGFVAERGGGLLLSGMVDEGFIGTPLADILPLTLVPEQLLPGHLRGGIRRGDHATGALFSPRLTGAGEFSPLLRLAADDRANLARWRQLPPLQGVFVSGRVKPGAAVLLQHPSLQYRGQPLPVLSSQRYGSGRSMALSTGSTWRWQMMMPSEDRSHELLWRQLLHWLASPAPQRLSVEFDREFYHAGDTVNVTARVLDREYRPDNDATLWLQTTDPLDRVRDAPMEWDLTEDGVYRSSLRAAQEGVYSLLVEVASAAGESAAEARERRAAFVVTPSLREFSGAGLDRGLLGRIAEAGGGAYFDLADAAALPAALAFTPGPYSRQVEYDLWDEPWLLVLLVTLLCVDWLSRRLKGLS